MVLFFICTYITISVNSFKVSECNNESLNYLFENDEIEFNRSINFGISCHTYHFDKIKFYELDTKSEFIDYLNKTETTVTDRPAMAYISIILFHIPNIKILKTEIHKIIQFITSPEDLNEYPNNIKNLYKIEITKIDPKKDKKDLFNKLPDLNHMNTYSHEKITQNVLNIFLLEDIKKNKMVIRLLSKEIMNFFFLNSLKNKGYTMLKILIIEGINNPKKVLFDDMNSRYKSNLKLMSPTIYIYFAAFELIENSNSYSHNDIQLTHKKNFYEEKCILKTNINYNVNSSLLFYKKPDINNLDYYIKFSNKNIEFEIYKFIDSNNTYTKLLNFLGYSPLSRTFGIKVLMKNGIQGIYFFEINVSIYKNIIKQANNQVPEIFKNIKKITVSRVNNNNSYDVLIDFSYEMNNYSSEGFPLFPKEREIIQEKYYNGNIEAKKLLNFIDFYESFMLGRNYFYFFEAYDTKLDLNNRFCFYKKEIWFKYLSIKQIYKILENSFYFKTYLNLRSDLKTFLTMKSIEVFEFTKEYTKNKRLMNSPDNIEVLKGFKNHHFFDIELRFYCNIKLVKYFNLDHKDANIKNFIKIDFGCNKTYFIFFREIINNWTDNDTFYNIINLKNEANIFLKPILKELLKIDDNEEAEEHALNFISVIFNMTKTCLNNNLELKDNFCYNLRKVLTFFLPKTQKWILIYLDIANNSKKRISFRKFKLITELFRSSIIIIKQNFQNILYEACVLRSISNISDKSQEILEILLTFH